MSKSHRQAERDSGTEHQRVGKRGSSGGDSSRGESDKEGGGERPCHHPRGERKPDKKVPRVQLLLLQVSAWEVLAHCRLQQEEEVM